MAQQVVLVPGEKVAQVSLGPRDPGSLRKKVTGGPALLHWGVQVALHLMFGVCVM